MNAPSGQDLLKKKLGGRNIYLVGMMGSGKTCTGPYLARGLGYSWIDTDNVIEKVCAKSISQIFEFEGEEGFRVVESQVLQEIGQHHSLIVATGGGLVTKSANWGVLHQGIVVWLDPGISRLLARLQANPGSRPLFKKDNPIEDFKSLYHQRERFYFEADLHLKVEEEDPEEVAKQIFLHLPAILSSPNDPGAPQTIAR